MMFNITIKDAADAQKFNAIATTYPGDIWVHGVQGQADAKSLLGLMLMTMENNVKLVCDDDTDEKIVRKEFADFIVD